MIFLVKWRKAKRLLLVYQMHRGGVGSLRWQWGGYFYEEGRLPEGWV